MADTNFLFLDIDGVLNSVQWYHSEEFQSFKKKETRREYEISHFDPSAVSLLIDFISETHCQIVLSSSWRKNHTLEDIREIFQQVGLGDCHVVDFTPSLVARDRVERTSWTGATYEYVHYPSRGEEIDAWLQGYQAQRSPLEYIPEETINYVIFDDDSDMLLKQEKHFFQTDNYTGLTPTTIYKAKRFLANV